MNSSRVKKLMLNINFYISGNSPNKNLMFEFNF